MKSNVVGLFDPFNTTAIDALMAFKELFRPDSGAVKDDICGIWYSFLCIELLIVATQSAPLLPPPVIRRDPRVFSWGLAINNGARQ